LAAEADANCHLVVGGVQYASQSDYRELFAATDHRDFHVVLVGKPFPSSDLGSKPTSRGRHSRSPFDPAGGKDQPDYRLVMVSDAANGLEGCLQWRDSLQDRPAEHGLRRLLPQRQAAVGDDGLDIGKRVERSARRPALS